MTFAFLFFDSVGGGEWLVLLAVVLIVVGPRNLPSAARKLGQVLSQLRRAADEFKRQIMTMDQELERTVEGVKKDYIEVADDVNKTVTDTAGDGSAPVSPDDADASDGDTDRAYDYYGDYPYDDETHESAYSDAGPVMEEPAAVAASEGNGAASDAPADIQS